MSDTSSLIEPADSVDAAEAPAARKRPKPGERRVQILQALAAMLEQPGAERITTAALAARLSVSEAALYRHFASKAQMFEGLIDFIEQSVFTLVQQITGRDVPAPDQPAEVGLRQASRIIALLLQFGERNPGMVRVMVGDALVFEHERLQQRMNQWDGRPHPKRHRKCHSGDVSFSTSTSRSVHHEDYNHWHRFGQECVPGPRRG